MHRKFYKRSPGRGVTSISAQWLDTLWAGPNARLAWPIVPRPPSGMATRFWDPQAPVDPLPPASGGERRPPAWATPACAILNQCLADALDLQSQCRQAHWHLRHNACVAPRFICVQAAPCLQDYTDVLGQRIGALGGIAEYTVAARSGLSAYPATSRVPQDHIDALAFAFWAVGAALGEDRAQLAALGDNVSCNRLGPFARLMARFMELLEAQEQVGH